MKKLKVQENDIMQSDKKELGITEYLYQGDIEIKIINGVKLIFHKNKGIYNKLDHNHQKMSMSEFQSL